MNAFIARIKAEIIAKAKAVSKSMSNDMMACVEACAECAAACEYCMSECLKAGANMKSLASVMKTCMECAGMCRTCASMCAQGAEGMAEMCAMCAKTCAACAAECAKQTDMECCVECAADCAACAKQCTNMATMKSAKSVSMHRAYSQITIKAIDEEKRIIEGIATTPTPDRYGDVVESSGAEFKLPMPFLMQHSSREPIGHVISAKVSRDGITIKAQLVKIAEPGALKERLDEAWQLIKSGLVRGLSIGFTPIESARIKDTYSEHYLKWAWLETSACVIAANADASITAIKSADQAARRATHGATGARIVRPTAGKSGSPDASGNKQPAPRRVFFPE